MKSMPAVFATFVAFLLVVSAAVGLTGCRKPPADDYSPPGSVTTPLEISMPDESSSAPTEAKTAEGEMPAETPAADSAAPAAPPQGSAAPAEPAAPAPRAAAPAEPKPDAPPASAPATPPAAETPPPASGEKPAPAANEKPASAEPPAAPGAATDAATAAATVPVAVIVSPIDKAANAPVKPGDWPMWGGTSYRNNVPIGKNIPTEWEVGDFDRKTGAWDRASSQNIKWVAQLGSQTYGNPVIAQGQAYVGTNNGAGWVKRYPSQVDLGCLLAFRETDGAFLWQDSSEKLPTGRVHDWPLQGICCAPYAEGDRLWYVTSRGEVKCLDAQGFHDNEDDGAPAGLGRMFDLARNDDAAKDQVGPAVAALNDGKLAESIVKLLAERGAAVPANTQVTVAEAGKKWSFTAKLGDLEREFELQLVGPNLSAFKKLTPADKDEADVVWAFDMMAAPFSISQHNMCSCSITARGDTLFILTSNGVDESHINIPAVNAPSFFAMNKNSGEVYWTDKSPGANIIHGQWASPTVAQLGGVWQVIFPGGDGWVYSFKADQGQDGHPELLWKFDSNPKESKSILGGRGTRNEVIGTPVVYDGLVYFAVGQDPEHGEGIGHLWCLDPTKRGDISAELAMRVANGQREEIPHRRLQAVIPEDGEVAVANPNSGVVWHYSEQDQNGDGKFDFEETMHRSCGTVAIKNDLLYVADFSGLFHCLDAKSGQVHWTYDMLAAAWGSPLIVEEHVYVGDEDGDISIFKLSAEPQEPFGEINMVNSVYSTPVVANNVLFISNKTHLFAIAPTE